MDIHENIKAVRTLISQEKLDELLDKIDTLMDYVYDNIDTLNEDEQLKQQIADTLQAGAKQSYKHPDYYGQCLVLAMACFLNGDIQGLCQNLITFLDEDKKTRGQPWSNDEFLDYIAFFYDRLPSSEQSGFRGCVSSAFERNYPKSAAAYYMRFLNDTLTDEERVDLLSKAIAADENFIVGLYWIAIYFQFNKNWKNAITYYNRCIDLGASNPNNYFALAWCYGKVKDYGNEIISYKKCLEMDPKFQHAMNNLGYAYEKSKDYEQALSCYQQAIKTNNSDVFPYRNTFRLLKKLKRYDEAVTFGDANKKRLSPSYRNDLDKLREVKNTDIPQAVIQDDIENEAETISEQPSKRPFSKSTGNSFLAESRLEDEIQARLDRGMPFFDLPLKMYDSKDGYGRQYIIPGVGRIDLLTVNTDNNDLYVIELKKGLGDDEIVGQVSRYMGWVKENLATDGQNVYGIICTAQASDKLKYAAEANPNIFLYNYSLNFSLA